MSKNERCRKYLITINNPKKHHFEHNYINELMSKVKWQYYCLCDETGEEGTYHTHLYFECKNAISFNTIKKLFPIAHIDVARGSAKENRDYIRKEGKYADTEKSSTNHPETFEEYGDLPEDIVSKNSSVYADVLEMIKSGASNMDIINQYPSFMTKTKYLDETRQSVLFEKYENCDRDVYVEYISGKTKTGKTSYVLNKYGYSNVYKITNYKNPFDNYKGQDIILFDEFRNDLSLKDMLNYLDKYPCRLPARYNEKIACYTKVYIVSNWDFAKQYENEQLYDIESYNAFVRRFNKISVFEMADDLPFDTDVYSVPFDLPVEQFYK